MSSFEEIVMDGVLAGQAGDAEGVSKQVARASVKMAVMRAMFCQGPVTRSSACGRILDQRSAALFSFGEKGEHGMLVVCGKCQARWEDFSTELSNSKGFPVLVETWRGARLITPQAPEVDGQLELPGGDA